MPKFTTPANSGAGARQFKDLRRIVLLCQNFQLRPFRGRASLKTYNYTYYYAEIYNSGHSGAGGRVKFLFKFVFKS